VVLAPDTGDGTGRRHLQGGRPQHEVETELCTIADVFGKINSIKTNPDCEAGCAGGTGICPNDWYPTGSDECSGACGAVFEPFVSSSCCICISGAYCSWRLFQYYTLLTHSSHPFAVLHVNVNVMCIEQWDQCGEMLTAAGMGGMDEMGLFCKAPHSVNLLLAAASLPAVCLLSVLRDNISIEQLLHACTTADGHCLAALYPPGSCGFLCNAHTYDCYMAELREACWCVLCRHAPAFRISPER
jgi:hypothetical protein